MMEAQRDLRIRYGLQRRRGMSPHCVIQSRFRGSQPHRNAQHHRAQLPCRLPGSAMCNRASWRGCVSYFTLATFSGLAAATRPH